MDQQDKSGQKWPKGKWRFEPSIPYEGVECYWIYAGTNRIGSIDGPQIEEQEAAATLCAAAPELYEALQWMVQRSDEGGYPDGKCLAAARAALAKATGSRQ
ncbi:hypothetical protein [Cupriavidus gilardii]|uniref:Uncharacterized protein n=1 Tax=Cupriavidus gilardii TaxID=82541 RepID=A0A849BNK0_9BURK|nr:hypothetical protein [Cupriavidus gilardii]KAB0597762.1 hypothetical protein F7Q96_07525 [Cupriavidus gilardii]NNH14067.1 hypothetical protein [Cupriavidus gilardii]